jgi:hypothetical protein
MTSHVIDRPLAGRQTLPHVPHIERFVMTHMALQGRSGRVGVPLRTVLTVDALTCVAMGVLLGTLSARLSAWLGLPAALLFWAGVVLLPCAVLMLVAARRPGAGLVKLVVLGNAAWVAASVLVLLVLDPTPLGVAFVAAQAVVVAALAWLEGHGSRG